MIWIGIDVSKLTLDCGWVQKKQKKHIKVSNSKFGFSKLLDAVPKNSRFVMEATGNYYLNIALFLVSKNKSVSVVNPIRIKNYLRCNLARNKNDKSDCYSIASFGKEFTPDVWHTKTAEMAEIQQLFTLSDKLKNQLYQLKNLDESFSQSILASKFCESSLKEVEQKISREIKKIEAKIEELSMLLYPDNVRILNSIPGIGMQSACRLLNSIGDISRFENSRKLISFLGLSPTTQQSGTSLSKRGTISRMGGNRVRRSLYFCALTASMHNQACIEMKKRMKEKGKPGKVIVVAIMNKLLRQAYTMLKKRAFYEVKLA